MSNLKHWQDKIKEKRKNTKFRDFLKEIASWKPYSFYKINGNISRYPDSQRTPNLISTKEFEINKDSPLFVNYNIKDTFFDNFKNLFLKIPISYLNSFYGNNENSDFCDNYFGVKNGYLSTTIGLDAENIFYSSFCYSNVRNIFDSFFITNNTENVYFSSSVGKNSYNVFYSKFINTSSNCWFSSNLIGCNECIFCDGLKNQSYCIRNKKYEKEQYFKEKNKILKDKQKFLKYYNYVEKSAINYEVDNCKGNALYTCNNVKNGYFFAKLKNGHNVMIGDGLNGCENFFDCFDVGVNSTDFYGCVGAGDNLHNVYLSGEAANGISIYYSYMVEYCSFCIGCIGLKNKSYCILNKQYTKEEWEKLADQIFSQMEKDGTLGDFFPGELNPFYFNDTMAGILGNFTKEEVEKEGYMWRDGEIKVDIPEGAEIIGTTPDVETHCNLSLQDFQGYDSNGNWKINPEIMKKIIIDEKGNYYKIVQMEYDFLMKYGLPLPEIHWLDRMKLNFGVK